MQRGIIKEVKEIASEGKKTFYEVILQDDSKMTTFDSKIKQADSGDNLEFEVTIAGRYTNLKDGWKLTKQTSSSGEGKPLGYQMSNEDWAEKDRITRASIESQKRADIISQLWIAEKIEKDDPLVGKLLSWLHKLEETSTPIKVIKQAEEDIEDLWPKHKPTEPEAEPKTVQDLLNWVASHGKEYTRSWVLSTFSFDVAKMRDNPYECYLEIKQMMNW